MVAALPGRALGAFTPIPAPPDVARGGDEISAFAASGSTWIALTGNLKTWMTDDQGATWRGVDLVSGAIDVGGFGNFAVGPDGAFYLGATSGGAPVLVRVGRDGQITHVPIQYPPTGRAGEVLVAYQSKTGFVVCLSTGDAISVARLNPADGSLSNRVDASPGLGEATKFEAIGGAVPAQQVWVQTETGVLTSSLRVVERPGTKFGDAGFSTGELFPAALPPLPQTIVAFRGLSNDGGVHWGGYYISHQRAVIGAPSLLERLLPQIPRPPALPQPFESRILAPAGPGIWRATDAATPLDTQMVVQSDAGLIAVGGDQSATPLSIERGPPSPLPATIGNPNGFSRRLVARANHFRAEAGVPPLSDDALIAKAAANHARYLALNHIAGKVAGQFHVEVKGKPGFTGVTAQDRCAAVGVSCISEVIESGALTGHAVDDWIASVYHRMPLTAAGAAAAGAGTVKHYIVMDVDQWDRGGLTTRPLGFPTGRYDGPLRMVRENPSPLDFCAAHGQPVKTAGVPVTLQTPTEEPVALPSQAFIRDVPVPDVLGVSLKVHGRAVPGCTRISLLTDPLQNVAFIPRGPLRPHTTYTATARWRIDRIAPVKTVTWKFRTR